MREKLLALLLLTTAAGGLNAGTLILKDGDTVSNVQVISIEGDRMVIEKDNTRKTISMGKVKGYYYTDVKGSGSFEEDVADYKVSVADVKMPQYTTNPDNKKGHSSTTNKQESCKITYNISREGEKSNIPRVKEPYFYLYLQLAGDKEHGNRAVYCFYHPAKQAKPKGKSSNKGGYDRAAVLATLNSFDRPIIYLNQTENKLLSGREIEIPFKSMPHRKILAYHLEVYGNSDLILEKDWHDFDANKGEWWKTY